MDMAPPPAVVGVFSAKLGVNMFLMLLFALLDPPEFDAAALCAAAAACIC